jgi:3-oxosteroid 1-dehydrogenase
MSKATEYDVIVLGTGIAGLAAALAAHEAGLRVLVLEKADKVGGGTTNSYGLIWIGNNHLAKAAGLEDSREDVLAYMRFVAGGEHFDERMNAYVDRSPEALKFFEACGIPFQVTRGAADHYAGVAPGAKAEGRTLEVKLISGFDLGEWRNRVRMSAVQPSYLTAEELIKWGGINNFARWDQELIAERQKSDMRGKGLGLVCQFLKALLSRKVEIRTGQDVKELATEGDRAVGVVTTKGTVFARHGVVLATAGYGSNPDLAGSFEKVPGWTSQVPRSETGDGLILATKLGAALHVIRNNMTLLLGFETAPRDRPAEREFHSAGIVELCSPHTIVVNRNGQRFADETYFQGMIPALLQFDPRAHVYLNLPCYLIFDEGYASSFSFGGIPAGQGIPEWVTRADTIKQLAGLLGVDTDGLSRTVRRFNGFAKAGQDKDFHRGELAFHLGRRAVAKGANATLGSISKPPFYGLELRPSSLPSAGLLVNAHAQVLDQRRRPITGLYAIGNTAASTDYGSGYQAGYSLCSGMTFGYLAAQSMKRARETEAAA